MLDDALLASLYDREQWQTLATVTQIVSVSDDRPYVRLLLGAAYAHLDPTRADAVLTGLLDDPLRPWALLQLAERHRDRDPWTSLGLLDDPSLSDPTLTPWKVGAEARLRVTVGDCNGAAAALPASAPLLQSCGRTKRSPVAGAVASAVLPGLGQAWSHQPVEAASAFFVVGSLAGGTVWAVADRRWPTAAALGALTIGFWSGNIYGGADAAIRFNRAQVRATLAALDAAEVPGGRPPPLPPPP
jgi:hypothetical protein